MLWKDRFKKYFKLSSKIFRNSYYLWNPCKTNNIRNNIKTESWFNILESNNPDYKQPVITNFYKNDNNEFIKCKKIRFYPTRKQRHLLHSWFKSFIIMYNKTIKYLNQLRFNKQPLILNWRRLRKLLINIKKDIIKKSKINTHVLDEAIKSACASFKSAFTNYKRGFIKRFRIRYIKLSKPKKILHIEKRFVAKHINTFCSRIFKDPFRCENEYQLKNITSDFKIHYNSRDNKYTFLIPNKIYGNEKHDKLNTIGLDPGIRTFLTGYSQKGYVDINQNMTEHLKKYINKIDKVNNDKRATTKQKRKVEKRCYKKIENKIDDMHWKTIKYLINNYNTVLMGNMSTRRIVSNKLNSKLRPLTKRIAMLMKLYVFKQRLQYKCKINKIGYKEIDEAYTSKCCSNCGLLNNKLGTSKIFKCPCCKQILDRDVNGVKNILINAIY